MSFSLLIIVKNRHEHLRNLLRALPDCTLQPHETIVVHMNEPVYGLDMPGLYETVVTSDHALPLAAARNAAAKQATTEQLIFLDVDCIPDPDCFSLLLSNLQDFDLAMVDPKYLSNPVSEDSLDFSLLAADGRLNAARDGITFGKTIRYEMFWSLGFAIRKADFTSIGGFDENFTGYGGEDTDFAFSARDADISFGFSKALVYHQNHISYDPPLNWLADITTNANYFHHKWKVWPMEGWLRRFESDGYIAWDRHTIRILRQPTDSEIQACRKSSAI